MQPNIPVPTDNFYKFVAMFGLLVFISTMVATVYYISKNNELVMKVVEESRNLSMKEGLTLEESNRKYTIDHLSKKIPQDIVFNMSALAGFLLLGLGLAIWGIYSWYKKVQPKQDELLNLQIEKTSQEISLLNMQYEKSKYEVQILEKQLEKKDEEKLST